MYLYQQNNISVGKEYITVGPDDNNTTLGDLNTFELGGKVEFNLTNLVYNTDTIKYSQEEVKLTQFKTELIERIGYIYYYAAMLRAVREKRIEVDGTELLQAEIENRKLLSWLKNITGIDLYKCGD